MLKLGKEKTILLSTHILQEVEAVASRVIIVNEGVKVADGPLSDYQQDGKSLASEFRRLTAGVATASICMQSSMRLAPSLGNGILSPLVTSKLQPGTFSTAPPMTNLMDSICLCRVTFPAV